MPNSEPKAQPRKTRRDKGLILATPRDLHVIAWIAHQYACRLDHIRELLSREAGAPTKEDGLIALSTTKDIIDRWRRAGWIEYQRFLANEPAWAWVTRSGLQLVGLDDLYVAKAPSPVRYRHIWATNDVRLHWWESDEEEQIEENEWISERQLRAEMTIMKKHPDRSPATLRILQGAIPDAVVVGSDWVDVVEVELTPKKPEETQAKLQSLCQAKYMEMATGQTYLYNTIHFYVPNKAMQHHLERARSHLSGDNQERIEVQIDESLQR